PDAERGVGAASMARAPHPLSRDLHHRFRGRQPVPAALPVARAAGVIDRDGVAAGRYGLPLQPCAAVGRLPAGRIHRLLVLPWRALPDAPCASASDGVLSDGVGGGRLWRAFRLPPCAGRLYLPLL